jgi:DUF1016 N-terminal domain
MKENRENNCGIGGTTFRGGQSSPVRVPFPYAKLGKSDVGVGKSATACGTFALGPSSSPDGTPKWTHEHEDKHIAMKKPKVVSLAEENSLIRVGHGNLMDRVVSILEQARTNVARSVNSNMVIAYWLVGREIVVALQGGGERAEYGERLLGDLSEQLTKRYGGGFSVTICAIFGSSIKCLVIEHPRFITRRVMNWGLFPQLHAETKDMAPRRYEFC